MGSRTENSIGKVYGLKKCVFEAVFNGTPNFIKIRPAILKLFNAYKRTSS
jgi:hypothetical protein